MLSFKALVTVAAAFTAIGSASPAGSPTELKTRADCGDTYGSCYHNNCDPYYNSEGDTIGWCQSGPYVGCPCDKCEGNIGPCDGPGCFGEDGWCTGGTYDGCPCK